MAVQGAIQPPYAPLILNIAQVEQFNSPVALGANRSIRELIRAIQTSIMWSFLDVQSAQTLLDAVAVRRRRHNRHISLHAILFKSL